MMGMRQIKVLVVDDSMFFRNILVKALESDPNILVVAQVSDAYEARDAIIKYKPDVMTLDVELPRMSGIEFLKKLMPQYPLPVVMISSLNDKVFDALDAGAVDFIHKPANLNKEALSVFVQQEFITKVKIASTAKVAKMKRAPEDAGSFMSGHIKPEAYKKVIAIGASTGGTEAIFEVVSRLKRDIPGVVIVQHMPPGFTKMYADRLNNQCEVAVKEAVSGDKVVPGQVLLAPGDRQMKLVKSATGYQVEVKGTERVNGHCPSVDYMFNSVAQVAGKNAVGVILTGMGADGAKGLLAMRNAGAITIGEDEASCVVYGMPKVAFDIGAVKYQVPLTQVASKIYNVLNQ